jgi:hypothetical protein
LLGNKNSNQEETELTKEQKEALKRTVPLLSRIDEVKTSKDFFEECTYFIELKGKRYF